MTFIITTEGTVAKAIYPPYNPLMAVGEPRPNLHSFEVAETQVKGRGDDSVNKGACHDRSSTSGAPRKVEVKSHQEIWSLSPQAMLEATVLLLLFLSLYLRPACFIALYISINLRRPAFMSPCLAVVLFPYLLL